MSLAWTIAFVALWILTLVLTILVLGILRRIAPLLAEAEKIVRQQHQPSDFDGLPLGAEVSPFDISTAEGDVLRFGEDLPLPAVFLFVQSSCEPCQELMADLVEHADSFAGTRLHIVTAGESDEYDALRARSFSVLEQSDGQASAAFKQAAFPNAFAVDRERKVVGTMSTTNSVAELERLVQAAHAYDEVDSIASEEGRVGG